MGPRPATAVRHTSSATGEEDSGEWGVEPSRLRKRWVACRSCACHVVHRGVPPDDMYTFCCSCCNVHSAARGGPGGGGGAILPALSTCPQRLNSVRLVPALPSNAITHDHQTGPPMHARPSHACWPTSSSLPRPRLGSNLPPQLPTVRARGCHVRPNGLPRHAPARQHTRSERACGAAHSFPSTQNTNSTSRATATSSHRPSPPAPSRQASSPAFLPNRTPSPPPTAVLRDHHMAENTTDAAEEVYKNESQCLVLTADGVGGAVTPVGGGLVPSFSLP